MAHRLDHRVSKLETNRPDYRMERIRNMPSEDVKRLLFLSIKNNFEGLSDNERNELATLDDKPLVYDPVGTFRVDEATQELVNDHSTYFDLGLRQYASEPLWLEDRNHIISAICRLSRAVQEVSLPDELEEKISPLIKRFDGFRYPWAYEPPFTEEEADLLANALSGKILDPEGPWFREYLKAHADLDEYYQHNGGRF